MKIFEYNKKKPEIADSCFLAAGSKIIGNVLLSSNVSIWFNAVVRGDSAQVVIGENSNVQDNSTLHADKGMPCVIGRNVTIGHNAVVHACTVGDGCMIGMGAIILSGAVIGEGSIIAAGTVLPEGRTVPNGTVYAGIPARYVRTVTEEEKLMLEQSAKNYVGYAKTYKEETEIFGGK